MIKIIKGDVFDTNARIIAHQVNCQGVMESGVAKQVRERYPELYKRYVRYPKVLGTVFIFDVHSLRKIANLYAQDQYGYDGKIYTDMEALRMCFQTLNDFAKEHKYTIAMPYKIACGLGGANWDEVYNMIEDIFEVDVELWRLD